MPLRQRYRRLLVLALFAIVMVAAGLYGAARYALWYYSDDQRFARSLPAFNAYAPQVSALPPGSPLPPLPKPFGAFDASGAERLPHGFLFFCDYGNPFDANGFAYSTQPLPHTVDEKNSYAPISGSWYKLWRN
jgi:hypothetical protein